MDLRLHARWTPAELDAIHEALFRHYRETQDNDKHWVKYINPDHVYKSLADGTANSVLADGYLVVFDVCVPWFNPDVKILQELLVLRVSPEPGRFRSVIHILDILCCAYGCDSIVVGDALRSDARLARLYSRHGFTPQANQLLKGKPQWAVY